MKFGHAIKTIQDFSPRPNSTQIKNGNSGRCFSSRLFALLSAASIVFSGYILRAQTVPDLPVITGVYVEGTDLVLIWEGGSPPFQIQSSTVVNHDEWTNVGEPLEERSLSIPVVEEQSFFRVVSNKAEDTVEVRYVGDSLVFMNHVPEIFGPNAIIRFDIGNDGTVEHQVRADKSGFYSFSLDTSGLGNEVTVASSIESADGSETGTPQIASIIRNPNVTNPATTIARKVAALPGAGSPIEPGICICEECGDGDILVGSSLAGFTHSYTPTVDLVELASGKIRQEFGLTGFGTRVLGFDFHLYHSSMVDYAGSLGQGFSHSFNMVINQTGETTGQIITPDLRVFDIFSEDGLEWMLPDGFFSELSLDPEMARWTLTHYSGLEVEFFQATFTQPGYPVAIRDPNGNETRLYYNGSSQLIEIRTDLGQVETLQYNEGGYLDSFSDHIGRTWDFGHDEIGRLISITAPETEYAHLEVGQEFTDAILPEVLFNDRRITQIEYAQDFPNNIYYVTDARGAVPTRNYYDQLGRVYSRVINGYETLYDYDPAANPIPVNVLDEGNQIVRHVDREGNITDYEIHGENGNPDFGAGAFGIRRQIDWTRSGLGLTALRKNEPEYWERRWLQSCNCLRPAVVTQPFSSVDAETLVFEGGIPTNWPRNIYTYNQFRQVVSDVYTDGNQMIRVESTYQEYATGYNDQFSRLLSRTDPRAFDDGPIYASATQVEDFTHRFEYDERGNQTRHISPSVTRGVETPQVIIETWAYNDRGQVTTYTDPNGNLTEYSYFEGTSGGGDVNTKGHYGGYLQSITLGATGSVDPETNLSQSFLVNSLGMNTRVIDFMGHEYDYEFNNMLEQLRVIEPQVTMRNGSTARYETRFVYDGAGNTVMTRRRNIDYDGNLSANEWVDHSMSYDAVNNMVSERVEVDNQDTNDLITRFSYDQNDDLIIEEKPEGNRRFYIHDERRLLLREFHGIAPGVTIVEGYPATKAATNLENTAFVGYTTRDYDARRNLIRQRDGRGNELDWFYDFYNRQIAASDQNGNGVTLEYDDASNILTDSGGAVSKADGTVLELLERQYNRYDEVGRGYQTVRDIDLPTDERQEPDPEGSENSSFETVFDAGSRQRAKIDANNNLTEFAYDAANRLQKTTDALGNSIANEYDANSNVVLVRETEVAGPGATGVPEEYVTSHTYDELNREVLTRSLGLNGDSIEHSTVYAYDSRGNARLVQDASGHDTVSSFDDFDRETGMVKFEGDSTAQNSVPLLRYAYAYDRNSRKIRDIAYSEAEVGGKAETTSYVYDNLDRRIRTVHPDSDDPIDGSSNGLDGIFDRVETSYDANSNVTSTIDERGVTFVNVYDPGNRLVEQSIDLLSTTAAVQSTKRQRYHYDALNRPVLLGNDFALIEREYDSFSNQLTETQSIQLAGSGDFAVGIDGVPVHNYENPIRVEKRYDKQSNPQLMEVNVGTITDLRVGRGFDPLNRTIDIGAAYLDQNRSSIVQYSYFGPRRIQRKTFANGARLLNTFDVKRRLAGLVWTSASEKLLVGFEYSSTDGSGYDSADNNLFERMLHDGGRYDHFTYNDRHELVGVEYRSTASAPDLNPGTEFQYDHLFNRVQAIAGDPFNRSSSVQTQYVSNPANEYTEIKVGGADFNVSYDRAGNMTGIPVLPVTGFSDQETVEADARWDAYDRLFSIDTGSANAEQHYRYDALGRRIASLRLSGSTGINHASRRYIYDGWRVVEERVFDSGATVFSSPSTLERIYVDGVGIDEHLLAAIDRNADGMLGAENSKNQRDIDADQEYFYLCNGLGSTMGLLDADNGERVLEYYRYAAYGRAVVLPALEGSDGIDLTPLDLSDNVDSDPQQLSEEFGNKYMFAGRRFDEETGLYYYRYRYHEPGMGRFISRDPIGIWSGQLSEGNGYAYVANNPLKWLDPLGLQEAPSTDAGDAAGAAAKKVGSKLKGKVIREGATEVITEGVDGALGRTGKAVGKGLSKGVGGGGTAAGGVIGVGLQLLSPEGVEAMRGAIGIVEAEKLKRQLLDSDTTALRNAFNDINRRIRGLKGLLKKLDLLKQCPGLDKKAERDRINKRIAELEKVARSLRIEIAKKRH